jgi:capsular exopolysaccharide synthesis family protein
MSLIERALEKSKSAQGAAGAPRSQESERGAADTVGRESQAGARRQTAGPLPRAVAEPQLRLTDSMLQEAGLRPPTEQANQMSAEYRHIKRQLLAGMPRLNSTNNRLIVVTSALAGEGKSFSAANLALSFALEPDYVTLLVDADVVKFSTTRSFGLTGRRGLMDAAIDASVDVESLVVSTDIPGLSIMPAGRPNANATEHFASARMAEIIESLLAPVNRILIVDSLPLLLTTEARALVAHGGQVVMVVRAESTPRRAVTQALELLDEGIDVKFVLNAVERDKLSGYYGYEYTYTYSDSGPTR